MCCIRGQISRVMHLPEFLRITDANIAFQLVFCTVFPINLFLYKDGLKSSITKDDASSKEAVNDGDNDLGCNWKRKRTRTSVNDFLYLYFTMQRKLRLWVLTNSLGGRNLKRTDGCFWWNLRDPRADWIEAQLPTRLRRGRMITTPDLPVLLDCGDTLRESHDEAESLIWVARGDQLLGCVYFVLRAGERFGGRRRGAALFGRGAVTEGGVSDMKQSRQSKSRKIGK